jgi:hypothetical protein
MNSRKNNLIRKPSLSMEQLEDRQMMAGDVTAFLSSGNLYISEAAGQYGGANAVQVSQLSNGIIRVKGLQNQAGGTTLVDGYSYRDFNVSGNLIMNLNGGSDTVLIGRDAPVTRFNDIIVNAQSPISGDPDTDSINIERVTTRGAIQVNTGTGTDYVNLYNTTVGDGVGAYDDLKINTGDGAYAFVNINNVTTKGLLDVRTGNGVDSINFHGSRIGDGVGIDNLNVSTGAGADTITFNAYGYGLTQITGHVNIYAYNSTEADADKLDMRSVYANQNINVLMGAGDDNVYMLGSWAGADIFLSGDKGKDTFRLTEVRSQDDFFAYMGEDDDTLHMEYVGADQMILDGGAGNDSVNRWNNAYVRDLALQNWETINGVKQVYFTGMGSQLNKGFATMS